MSGILALAAGSDHRIDPALLERMTSSMRFRGPHGTGFRALGQVGLGHSLLALEDETPQPRSLDDRAWIVGDIRLDAREELIASLASQRIEVPPETPDCDLILHAYRAWGEDLLDRIAGDFAFALWDWDERRLLCARDQLGVRPLFYAVVPSGLVVSNTMQTVRLHPEVGDELDDTAIADFLLFIYKQDASATAMRDIRRLPSGHRLVWRQGEPAIHRYWSFGPIEPLELPRPEDYVDRYRTLLRAAVSDRTRVDRIQILMSGGLDSTSLAAFSRRLSVETGRPAAIEATTVVSDGNMPDEERHYAAIAAAHLGILLRLVSSDEYELFDRSEELPRTPEPNSSPRWALELDVYRRSPALVGLYGIGPDDLLRPPTGQLTAHVRHLRLFRIARELATAIRLHGRLPRMGVARQIARRVVRNREDGLYRYRIPPWISPDLVSRLDLAERVAAGNNPPPIASTPRKWAALSLSSDRLAAQVFEPMDAGWTHQTVQFRFPHVDLRVARFLASVPFAEWQRGKGLLRLAARGMLPAAIVDRPKTALGGDLTRALLEQGFPFSSWKPDPRLERYVDLSYFDTSGRKQYFGDGLDRQLWLQVLSLGQWLSSEPNEEGP